MNMNKGIENKSPAARRFLLLLTLYAVVLSCLTNLTFAGENDEGQRLRDTESHAEISVPAGETGGGTYAGIEKAAEEDLGTYLSAAAVSEKTEDILSNMPLRDKVAQLFVTTPDALTGAAGATAAGSATEEAFSNWPVGGIIYMEPNIQTWDQTSQLLSSMQEISLKRTGLPVFLAVDEEGGSVRRVSGRLENVPYIQEMESIGNSGDPLQAYETGKTIGDYLHRLGFNLDFAPVADVLTNSSNTVIGSRSFGADPILVANMVTLEVQGLRENGICATLKHFPGHGNSSEDSHQGLAVSYKTLEELRECEFIPFERGIMAGADFVMAGHIAMPNITGDYTPASMSNKMLTEILRGDLGFDGIIITDSLDMGAIVNSYGLGEAAAEAFLAGADMVLVNGDFQTAFDGLVEAVEAGRISTERLDESLRRIVALKIRLMNAETNGIDEATRGQAEVEDDQHSYESVIVGIGF